MTDCPTCEGEGTVCSAKFYCRYPDSDEECPLDCEFIVDCPKCKGTGERP